MSKNRLEAFSDGVLAIIITIMVLELKVPHGTEPAVLLPMLPVFGSYVLSYLYVGIYWNNHHHLLHSMHKVTGGILWANLHLLFWLSLLPFATGWMGENHLASIPTAMYGFVLTMAGVAYFVLSRTIIKVEGRDSLLAKAMGRDFKGVISVVIYFVAMFLAFLSPWLANMLYFAVAIVWLIPDRRIERRLS